MLIIRLLFYGAGTLGAAYMGLGVSLYMLQSRLAHHPNTMGRDLVAKPASIGLSYEEISLLTYDGVRLHGWYLPATPSRGVLLFCHGNAGNISHRLYTLHLFHGLGLSTLIFDYRGYGLSEGSPTDEGLHWDAQAALRYLLVERRFSADRIILFGRSLGGAIAAQLAKEQPVAALILDSTFTSAADLAADLYPWLPARWLTRLRYDTLAALRASHAPTLILHSREDELINLEHGQRLYQAACAPKSYAELRGPHGEAHLADKNRYYQALAGFVDDVLGPVAAEQAS